MHRGLAGGNSLAVNGYQQITLLQFAIGRTILPDPAQHGLCCEFHIWLAGQMLAANRATVAFRAGVAQISRDRLAGDALNYQISVRLRSL
jgi:hypothetical protein